MYLQSATLGVIVTYVKQWNISISSYDNTADYSWTLVIAGQETKMIRFFIQVKSQIWKTTITKAALN